MRTMKKFSPWPATALMAALMIPAAQADSVKLDVQMSTPVVLAGTSQKAYMRVALTGLESRRRHRAPVNVAIVLDRSGSMGGSKIEEAKRAALMALRKLGDDDIVSIITYHSTVDVLVPATKLSDRGSIRRAIQGIEAGGRTALFAGVSKGARELRKFVDRNRVNTLILLSDGLANVGPSSPGELGRLGASLAREGITVTTIGLGLQYNEDLMTRLAMASDGNHFFVEDEEDLELAFATEFGDALSVVGQGFTIYIECPPGVRPIRMVGREAEIAGREVHASLNQIYRDQTRYLLLEVELSPADAGKAQRVGDVEVGYYDLDSGSRAKLQDSVSVTYAKSPAAVEKASNREVMTAVVSQIGAERNEAATALRDKGKVEEARVAFESNSVYLQENAQRLDAPQLQDDAAVNLEASENLGEKEWNRERKKQVEGQYKTRQQRAVIPQRNKN